MAKDNCLVIQVGRGQELLQYQIEMLHYNPHPGIIPVRKKFNNQEISLHYQLGSRQALTEYLRHGGSWENIILLLIKIVDILQDSKNLLLNPASFKLEPSCIYLDDSSGDVALLYQPFETSLDIQESLISFSGKLSQIFPLTMDKNMGIQPIYQYLEKDYTNLVNLKKFLTQLSLQGPRRPIPGQKKPFKLDKEKKSLAEKREKGNINLMENKEEKGEFLKIRSKRKELSIFTLVQILIAIILLSISSYLNSQGNSTATYVGLALLLGGTNILLLRRLFLPDLSELQQSREGKNPADPNIANKELAFRLSDKYKE